jgi:hypothetical protein
VWFFRRLRRQRRQLRQLAEAEVYARSYGDRSEEVTNVKVVEPIVEAARPRLTDRSLRNAFLARLDDRNS